MYSQANSEEHFSELCFSLPPHNQSLCPSDNGKIQSFYLSSKNFMKLSGLHSYSQRLNSHVFLLTSLVLTFEVWLWKSLAHPRKTNKKNSESSTIWDYSGMFEKVLSLPLSKRCRNGFPPCKKPIHPFLMCAHPTHTHTCTGAGQRGKVTVYPPYFKDRIESFIYQPM